MRTWSALVVAVLCSFFPHALAVTGRCDYTTHHLLHGRCVPKVPPPSSPSPPPSVIPVPSGVQCKAWCNKWTVQQGPCTACTECDDSRCSSYKGAPTAAEIAEQAARQDEERQNEEEDDTNLQHDAGPGAAATGTTPKAHEPRTRTKGTVPSFPSREAPKPPGTALGPVPDAVAGNPNAGWIIEGDGTTSPSVVEGAVRLMGDSRVYLVNNHQKAPSESSPGPSWGAHTYARFDLSAGPLSFTLDLSNVPCGCLACVYLVAMQDPAPGTSNYCDM